jgi:adenosine kinase
MKILVSGSLAYDRIMDFPGRFADHILPEKIHNLNVCFMVNGVQEKFGGTAGNIAYNLALLGEAPVILAAAGKDFSRYRQWLEHLGLSLEGIREVDAEFTASAYITTDQANNQITGFNPGAMRVSSGYRLNDLDPRGTLAIIAPGNLDDMLTLSRRYKELGVPYIFDPGQSIPALSPLALAEMTSGAALLISNDYELEMIKKSTRLDLKAILKRCLAVITTLGENGSVVHDAGSDTVITAAANEGVVDPTGAGDAYRAGVLLGMCQGRNLAVCARMGSVCASFAVSHQGTQEHHFTADTFWQRYNLCYDPIPGG